MPDRMPANGVDFGAEGELTDLEHAASLLEQVQDAHDYEQGTAFAVKSIAHSVLHMARGSGVTDPMSLRVLAVQWERRAGELAQMQKYDAQEELAEAARRIRVLLGDES